jgi:hypothetical protein
MEVYFEDLSDDKVDDLMMDYQDGFEYDDSVFDDSHFSKKRHDGNITEVHKKLMDFKTKFEQTNLFGLMELNAEYRNYYNGLKTMNIEDDKCILDVPTIKMDVEQIDTVIMSKQAERSKPVKQNGLKSRFSWRFKH